MGTGVKLVVGATGTVGSCLVKELAAKGVPVNAGTRNPAKVGALPGVKGVKLDLRDPATFSAALKEVDAIFVLSPSGQVGADELLGPFLDAAFKQAGRIVLMTAAGVERNEASPLRKVEHQVLRSGTECVVLRPSWFMQNFHNYWLRSIEETGNVSLPAGNGKTAFIDVRDIGAVAARFLTDVKPRNEALKLTGPEALTYGQAAAILSRETGRKISYVNVDEPAFRKSLLDAGTTPEYADILLALFATVRSGYAAEVTQSVSDVLGSAPRSIVDYARDYKAQLQ